MGYPLDKLFRCCFQIYKGLIRHLIIWKTLHFKALTWVWFCKLKGPTLPKEKWGMRVVNRRQLEKAKKHEETA
jgi:hypothetical protein